MSPKVAIAQINSTVGDLSGNRERIARFARQAAAQGADIVLTPELSLTGYPPEDLLLQHSFHSATQLELDRLKNELADLDNVHVLVGHHCIRNGLCYNACSILVNGAIIGTYEDEAMFRRLEEVLHRNRINVIKPEIVTEGETL